MLVWVAISFSCVLGLEAKKQKCEENVPVVVPKRLSQGIPSSTWRSLDRGCIRQTPTLLCSVANVEEALLMVDNVLGAVPCL